MDLCQTIDSGEPSASLSRSFWWAVVLHGVAAIGVILGVRGWSAVSSFPLAAAFELEVMAASPAVVSAPRQVPVWVPVEAAAGPELRTPPVLSGPVPEAMPVAPPSSRIIPVMKAAGRPGVPDWVREDTRALAALPLRSLGTPLLAGTTPSSVTGDGEGRPVALSEIRPNYPNNARTLGQEGTVRVRLHVTSGGEVESAEIGKSSGVAGLDQSAVSAARKARFKPAQLDGKPVPADLELQFEFRLKD